MSRFFLPVALTFLFFCSSSIAQQDSLKPLTYNPYLKASAQNSSSHKKTISVNSVGPLFFDDFAYLSSTPDPAKWDTNSAVFINRSFARAPFSIGVATFDGLNKYGYPYTPAAATTTSASADTLTSLPIDLSFIQSTDTSVYLSFFYQSRGWGDAPETADSLILQFYNTANGKWSNAWAKAGFSSGPNDSSWKLIMVQVANPVYFNNDFRFRFTNRACPCGAVDHWNLDYVWLNAGRTPGDTIFKDITFGYEAPSLLKNYSSMPYWAVTASDMATNYPVFIRNNNYTQQAENFFVPFDVFDQNNAITNISTGSSNNIDNFIVGGWDNDPAHVNQSLAALPAPVLNDSATYKARLFIAGAPNEAFDGNHNDTLYGYTHFYNYYAYDDGTAEIGYYLNQTGSMMAVQFTLNGPDTLRAMDIFFDPMYSILTIQNSSYELWVWDNNGGQPGSSIYTEGPIYPTFASNVAHNTFKRDTLSTPLALSAGTYYIGIKQTSSQPLNVGFDRNYNHSNKMFYNTSGNWNNSSFAGSYMIRPVMRKLDLAEGISHSLLTPGASVKVYPNPASEKFIVDHSILKSGDMLTAEIFDFSGRMLKSERIFNNDQVDISSLSSGVYILKISDRKSVIHTTKLFVTH